MAGSLENRGKLRELIDKFQFANFPFERGEILFSKGFFDFRIFVNYKTKAKTSYTLSTSRSRFDYENSLAEVHPELVSEWSEENLPLNKANE